MSFKKVSYITCAMIIVILAAFGLSGCGRNGKSYTVPLTVEERSGVDVDKTAISNGVPLPIGAVFKASDIKLEDSEGNTVEAGFSPLTTWQDGSWRFAQVSFLTDLKAEGKSRYMLITGKGGNTSQGLKVKEDKGSYTVSTGPLQFKVLKKGFNVIDQVWVDDSEKGKFTDTDKIVDSHDRGIVVNLEGTEYSSAKGQVISSTIERRDNASLVLRTEGSLGNGSDRTLDYKVWIKAWAGSKELEVSFNIAKKNGETWDDYYNINKIAVEVPLLTKDTPEFTFGGEDSDYTGKVDGKAYLNQKSSKEYDFINGGQVLETVESGKTYMAENTGWAEARDGNKGLGVAYRWFWQNFPSTLALDEKGVLSAQIWSETYEPLKLYTGVAKTTDLRFYFRNGEEASEAIANRLKSFQLITIAKAPASWYCQDTRAVDPHLLDLNPENWPEKDQPYIEQYKAKFNEGYFLLMDSKKWDSNYAPGEDGYGFLNFGDGVLDPGDPIDPWSPEVTWWSNNYYDHPNNVLIHFFRTGDLKFLDYAMQHEYHLMDIDTASYDPEDKLPGEYKSCPSVMHIKRYTKPLKDSSGRITDYAFGDQGGHWHFQGVEGLYNTYYMTGISQAIERGLESSDYAVNMYTMNMDTETRSIGHTLEGLAAAYRHTWDEKYLERMNWVWQEILDRIEKGPVKNSDTIPYREEFKPYIYVRNWPFQSGMVLDGIYKYRAFSPFVKGELGLDNVSKNTLWVDIWERDTGTGYNSGWLKDQNRWNYASDIMTASGAWLHPIYPDKGFLDILKQAAINNVESDFSNQNSKTFSQSFVYQWITQYELAANGVRNRLYASFTAYPRTIKAGGEVTFNNQSIGMKSCKWSFGDGESSESTGVNVSHKYKKPGKYDVRLVVRDKTGKSETLLIEDYITVE